jgi:formylglycine-generating enzyme
MKRTAVFVVVTLLLIVSGCTGVVAGPIPSFDTGINPENWARILSGDFLMGQHNHATMIAYDYEIMVTDVTNAQYAKYLNAALAAGKVKVADGNVVSYYPGDVYNAYRHERNIIAGDYLNFALNDESCRLAYTGKTFSVKPGYENHPVTLETWFGAWAYCNFYGYRLPTEAEWEKAARGSDGRAFPWGNEITKDNANYYKSYDPFEESVGGTGDTSPVGFYNGKGYDGYQTINSPSPYGLYDMAGNVWQWTADITRGMSDRHLRGGSKIDYEYDLRVWTRTSASPDYCSPSVGFRCVRDVSK